MLIKIAGGVWINPLDVSATSIEEFKEKFILHVWFSSNILFGFGSGRVCHSATYETREEAEGMADTIGMKANQMKKESNGT